MTAYSVYEARNKLSRLIADVESGLEVTITKHGREVARIVPPTPRTGVGKTGRELAEWLDAHPLPARLARSSEEIDAIIEENRNAWE